MERGPIISQSAPPRYTRMGGKRLGIRFSISEVVHATLQRREEEGRHHADRDTILCDTSSKRSRSSLSVAQEAQLNMKQKGKRVEMTK